MVTKHHRLKWAITYLIGAMDRVVDGGTEWREAITPKLRARDIIVINPCDKPTDLGNEGPGARQHRHNLAELGEYDELRSDVGMLRAFDLRATDKSDFLIFKLDPQQHLCGSYNEVFISNLCKKPILTLVDGGKKKAPLWMFATIPHQHIFSTEDEMLEYIRHVDEDDYIQHFKRWTFLDYDRLFEQNGCRMERNVDRYDI